MRMEDSGCRGVVLKKKWGTPETRLRQRFLNVLGLRTRCTEIILHCVSVSNQLQQWTNFCTNFSPEKVGGSGGRVDRSGRTPYRRRPRPPTPLSGGELVGQQLTFSDVTDQCNYCACVVRITPTVPSELTNDRPTQTK